MAGEQIEQWELTGQELWAVVRSEALDRVIAAVCDRREIADAVAAAENPDGEGGMLVDEPCVLPCFVSGDGWVVLANDVHVTTHAQLRAAMEQEANSDG